MDKRYHGLNKRGSLTHPPMPSVSQLHTVGATQHAVPSHGIIDNHSSSQAWSPFSGLVTGNSEYTLLVCPDQR